MVIEGFRDILTILTVTFAGFAAITGLIVLNLLFHNRLKDLFDDAKYFILFSLVFGYILYAVGEVSFYLMEVLSKNDSGGIADVYWAGGAIFVVVAFLVVFYNLMKVAKDASRFYVIGGVGVVLVGGVVYLVTQIIAPQGQEISFFNYFYPFVGALIVTFGCSAFLFPKELGSFSGPLRVFFLASLAIFIGDILFLYSLSEGSYLESSLGSITDTFYCAGYGLSVLGFFQMYKHIHSAGKK